MIVAGNWKMNLNINEAIELSNGLLKHNEVFVEEKINKKLKKNLNYFYRCSITVI